MTYTEKQKQRVFSLVDEGYNYAQVEKKTGIPARSIARWIKDRPSVYSPEEYKETLLAELAREGKLVGVSPTKEEWEAARAVRKERERIAAIPTEKRPMTIGKMEEIQQVTMRPIEKPKEETKQKDNPKTLELDTCGACGADIPEGRPKNCPSCGGEFAWLS